MIAFAWSKSDKILRINNPNWLSQMTRCALVVAFSMVITEYIHAKERSEERPNIAAVFSALKIGQLVTLDDKQGGMFDIVLLNDGAIGSHKVIELGVAHLLVEDIVGVSRRWIPVTSIRAIVWSRVPVR